MSNQNQQQIKPVEVVDSRFYSIITYAPPSEIEIVLMRHMDQIVGSFYICHDKDVDKEKHWHLLLWLKYARRASIIERWFAHCMDENNNYVNTFVQHTKNTLKSYRYLTHADDSNKYQYDEIDIISAGASAADYCRKRTIYDIKGNGNKRKEKDACRALNIIDELINGASCRDMVNNYGRDFIINRRHYTSAAALVALQESKHLEASRLSVLSGDTLLVQACQSLRSDLVGDSYAYVDEVDDDKHYDDKYCDWDPFHDPDIKTKQEEAIAFFDDED